MINGMIHSINLIEVKYTGDATFWKRNGEFHRDGGPAVMMHDGRTLCWYQDGVGHRDDGPSTIWFTGLMSWQRHGRLHREDGPAVIWENGEMSFWVNGVQYAPTPDGRPDMERSLWAT